MPGGNYENPLRRSVFEVFERSQGGVDMIARSAFDLREVDEGGKSTERYIPLSLFRVKEIEVSSALNLRERKAPFLSAPGGGSSVTVTHRLGLVRILGHEQKLPKE